MATYWSQSASSRNLSACTVATSGYTTRCSWGTTASPVNRIIDNNLKVVIGLELKLIGPGEFECNFRNVIFKRILVIDGWGISCEIALIWMSLDFTDDQSTLVQVMAWCCQATSHYLSPCWPMISVAIWCYWARMSKNSIHLSVRQAECKNHFLGMYHSLVRNMHTIYKYMLYQVLHQKCSCPTVECCRYSTHASAISISKIIKDVFTFHIISWILFNRSK